MTELLSRERELLKLNEQLNQMATKATTLVEQQQQQSLAQQAKMKYRQQQPMPSQQQQQPRQIKYNKQPISPQQSSGYASSKSGSTGSTKTEQSVGCQSPTNKTKAQAMIMRRRLIGDGIPEKIENSNTTTTLSKGRDTYRFNRYNGEKTKAVANTPTTPTALPRRFIRGGGDMGRSSNSPTFKNPTPTFTVRYRNHKFVQSPSLEVLVKDEYSTMHCNKTAAKRGALGGSFIDSHGFGKSSDTTSSGATPRSSVLSTGSFAHKQISNDGLIKFLKSKIMILEEDHERLTQEMNQQKDLLEKALECSKQMEQQRDQAYAKHNALTEQLTKVEMQLEENNQKAKEQADQYVMQQKELEIVKRDLKIATQTNKNLEKRLYRVTEDLNNARNALTGMKNAERELKELNRTDAEAKDKQIKSLKKQRADLLNAYKKQLFLIDNLKRQNICMEQAKMIEFGEKEFCKVLDWKVPG